MASKLENLKEACETLASAVSLKCCDLTLLINACDEAAKFRSEHGMPYAEKYLEMSSKLRLKSAELEQRIDSWCQRKAKNGRAAS